MGSVGGNHYAYYAKVRCNMTETQMHNKLKLALRKCYATQNLIYQAIESPSTGVGIPDVWYSVKCNGMYFNSALEPNQMSITESGWVEYKIATSTGKRSISVPFRPGQLPWLKKALAANVTYFLVLYLPALDKWAIVRGQEVRKKFSDLYHLEFNARFVGAFRDLPLDFLLGRRL